MSAKRLRPRREVLVFILVPLSCLGTAVAECAQLKVNVESKLGGTSFQRDWLPGGRTILQTSREVNALDETVVAEMVKAFLIAGEYRQRF